MQKRLIVVMILVLLGTSAAVADELCHTTHFTILSRAVDAMQHAMNLLKDFEDEDRHGDIADGLLALQARGDITRLDPGTELYVKEAWGAGFLWCDGLAHPTCTWRPLFGASTARHWRRSAQPRSPSVHKSVAHG
jgi:hypothetical protein